MKVCPRDVSHPNYSISKYSLFICARRTVVASPLCKVIFANSLESTLCLGLILRKIRSFRYFDVDIFNRKVLA